MQVLEILLAFSLMQIPIIIVQAEHNTLMLVHALFRHGDRTVDLSEIYPKDPYLNYTYAPFGIGQLTSRGKENEFLLGQLLGRRYGSFLETNCNADVLEAVSTNVNRTKASLLLVLAGLCPPKSNAMEWHPDLNWQPIPYNYLSLEDDMWMTYSMIFCHNYAKIYADYLASEDGRALLTKYKTLYQYLTNNTGMDISNPFLAWGVYGCLKSQKEFGLKLPLWTESVFPEQLREATIATLLTIVATQEMKQLSGGFMLERIINNMRQKIENKLEPEGRRLFLYSAHDLNIIFLLGAMNVYYPHIIPYSASVLIELHKINHINGVRIYYQKNLDNEPEPLRVPGCDYFCPFQKFVNLLEPNIPNNISCGYNLGYVQHYSRHRKILLGQIHHKYLTKRYTRTLMKNELLSSDF